jgi:inorganic pyrophosphatase
MNTTRRWNSFAWIVCFTQPSTTLLLTASFPAPKRLGDPVDILVMTSEPTFTGCLIEVRPVGLFHMQDEAGADEKILSVPTIDPHYHEVQELAQVAPHFLREVEHFFRIYKELEGKPVETLGWEGRIAAEQARQAHLKAR